MNNYNWLFDIGKTNRTSLSTSNQPILELMPELRTPGCERQLHGMACHPTNGNVADTYLEVNGHSTLTNNSYRQPSSHAALPSLPNFDQSRYDVTSSVHNTSNFASVSPVSNESNLFQGHSPTHGASLSATDSSNPTRASTQETLWTNPQRRQMNIPPPIFNTNPPLPRSHCQRIMPTLDEVSRNQALDLLVNARPQLPDGSEITRDHALLSLSSLQNYLDLFFSRFNVAYPLLHRATFDPSEIEPLLLLAVLLLGATYSDKASHRLSVCIHDVLRAQIFQHAAFSATPELWMLQTILLVECFGKSRAGQKQHDMAHLFHGLLIKYVQGTPTRIIF